MYEGIRTMYLGSTSVFFVPRTRLHEEICSCIWTRPLLKLCRQLIWHIEPLKKWPFLSSKGEEHSVPASFGISLLRYPSERSRVDHHVAQIHTCHHAPAARVPLPDATSWPKASSPPAPPAPWWRPSLDPPADEVNHQTRNDKKKKTNENRSAPNVTSETTIIRKIDVDKDIFNPLFKFRGDLFGLFHVHMKGLKAWYLLAHYVKWCFEVYVYLREKQRLPLPERRIALLPQRHDVILKLRQ